MSSNLKAIAQNNVDIGFSKTSVELVDILKDEATNSSSLDDREGSSSIIQSFTDTLKKHQNESQIIVIQDFPDPDALSSAWAYKLIAETYNIRCDIVYGGRLSHQENITLVKLTNLPAQRHTAESLHKLELSSYQGCVLLDSQGTNSQLYPILREAEIPLTVVIVITVSKKN